MSLIFLSHSSADTAEAIALASWLREKGFDDIFLDVDPDRGISPGERWERALAAAADRCEAVVFLVSEAWLSSVRCLHELQFAVSKGKQLFGVLIADLPLSRLPPGLTRSFQNVNLAIGSDHLTLRAELHDHGIEQHVTFSAGGLRRLENGLKKAGLDPRFFDWPPNHDPSRAPWRGLKPLEAEDAGIFFGREAHLVHGLDRLRGLVGEPPGQYLVILGASGAGKSSFLRAGLWPRLARDDRHFLPLPVIRPERAAISGEQGLVRSVERAFQETGAPRNRAAIRAAVRGGAETLSKLLGELADAARPEADASQPTLILAVDQAEELFHAQGYAEAEQLLGLVRDIAFLTRPRLFVVFTIRSDAYEPLQTAKELEGLKPALLSLPPIPTGQWATIIEGPLKRLAEANRALKVEPTLTERLLADLEKGGGRDALPLLSFTLERLYSDYGGDGDLRLEEYEAFGGIAGAIDAAVAGAMKAADTDPGAPKNEAARMALLRSALIPWLAGIDPDTGAPRRLVARLSEIPEETRPLVAHLVNARLLTTNGDVSTKDYTIEPAHEALLRQWRILKDWLAEDAGALATLEAVKRATRDWVANARSSAWLSHHSGRLEDAERLNLRPDLAAKLDTHDHEYLATCRELETEARGRELQEARKLAEAQRIAAEQQKLAARRTRIGAIAALILAVIAMGTAYFGFDRAIEAGRQRATAIVAEGKASEERKRAEQSAREARAGENLARRNEAMALDALASAELLSGRPLEAMKVALAAWPRANDINRPQLVRTMESLGAAVREVSPSMVLPGNRGGLHSASFLSAKRTAITVSSDGTARIWDLLTGTIVKTLSNDPNELFGTYQPMSPTVLVAFPYAVSVWDFGSGKAIASIPGATNWYDCNNNIASADRSKLITSATNPDDFKARVWDTKSGELLQTIVTQDGPSNFSILSPNGDIAATVTREHVSMWRVSDATNIADLYGHTAEIRCAIFSDDGDLLATMSADSTARIWNAHNGQLVSTLSGHRLPLSSIQFSLDQSKLLTASLDGTARIYNVKSGKQIMQIGDGTLPIHDATFDPKGVLIATAHGDSTVRIWDAASGRALRNLKGHSRSVKTVEFSSDGTSLLSASEDGTARWWRILQLRSVPLIGHVSSVNFATISPEGSLALTASSDGTARLWSLAGGLPRGILKGHVGTVSYAAFSPDGTRIVTIGDDRTVRYWNRNGEQLAFTTVAGNQINQVQFSPNGRVIAIDADEVLLLWDPTSAVTINLKGTSPFRAFSYSLSGDYIVSTSLDETATVWNVKTGSPMFVLKGHTGPVNSARYSPNDKRIITSSGDSSIRIWDAESGVSRQNWTSESGYLVDARFSCDGRTVLGRGSKNLHLWNAQSGKRIGSFESPRANDSEDIANITSAEFSKDCSRVALTTNTGEIQILDAMTLAPIGRWEYGSESGYGPYLYNAEFSPDGADLVVSAENATAGIWDVSELMGGDLPSLACKLLGNDTDLGKTEHRYDLSQLKPICGDHPPLPVDLLKLE